MTSFRPTCPRVSVLAKNEGHRVLQCPRLRRFRHLDLPQPPLRQRNLVIDFLQLREEVSPLRLQARQRPSVRRRSTSR